MRRDGLVARNYAETLFELARRHDALEEYGEAISLVGDLIDQDPQFRLFLETPRIVDADKKELVRKVFADTLPRHVLNFVLVTIDKRRQRVLRWIAVRYRSILDEHMGREHVQVAVARPVDESTSEMIAERLSKALGKKVIPHIRVQPEIVGGLVVRTRDTIYDGSVRRRLDGMRRRLLKADIPRSGSAAAASDS